MKEIQCIGINEKGLPPLEFQRLFHQELLLLEGRVVHFGIYGNIATGVVIK